MEKFENPVEAVKVNLTNIQRRRGELEAYELYLLPKKLFLGTKLKKNLSVKLILKMPNSWKQLLLFTGDSEIVPDVGLVMLHPNTCKPLVACTQLNYWDSSGCPPTEILVVTRK